MTEKRRFCVKKILRIAVGLGLLFKGVAKHAKQKALRWILVASNAQNLNEQAKDSRICDGAKAHPSTQAVGFADDFLKKPAAAAPCTAIAGFGGFQAVGAGIYLGVNEQARAAESTIYRKTSKAQFL